MLKSLKLLSFFIIFVVIFLNSCTKEKIVKETVYKEHRWERDLNFSLDNSTILNSYADSNKMFFLGKYLTFLNNGQLNTGLPISYNNTIYPINGLFYPSIVNNNVIILKGLDPQYGSYPSNAGLFTLKMVEYDKNFEYFIYPDDYLNEIFKINQNNQLLVPYLIKNNISIDTITFSLINVRSDYNIYKTDTLKTKKIKIFTDYNYGTNHGLFKLFTKKDYFLAGIGTKLYKIKSDGTYSIVYDNSKAGLSNFTFFEQQNIIYFISSEGIFKSIDDGENWIKIIAYSSFIDKLFFIKYTLINNEIVGFYDSQIFHLTLTNDVLTTKEIDNDGLIGNQITSIKKYKDVIYVTTLSGVYKINYQDFYKYKQ